VCLNAEGSTEEGRWLREDFTDLKRNFLVLEWTQVVLTGGVPASEVKIS
jgi:hypothetical protein